MKGHNRQNCYQGDRLDNRSAKIASFFTGYFYRRHDVMFLQNGSFAEDQILQYGLMVVESCCGMLQVVLNVEHEK